jgi:hypothetical protein
MPESRFKLPVEVEKEAGPFLAELRAGGWQVSASEYDASAFGNWFVDLERNGVVMRLVKDRSQYLVTSLPKEALKAAGLWQAFDTLNELQTTVARWANRSLNP